MNPEQNIQEQKDKHVEQKLKALNSVTTLSKYLAMILFIILPFVGGWIGYTYAPVKIIEIEKVTIKEVQHTDDAVLRSSVLECAGTACEIAEIGITLDVSSIGTTTYLIKRDERSKSVSVLLSASQLYEDDDQWCEPESSPLGIIVRLDKVKLQEEYDEFKKNGYAPHWLSDIEYLTQASKTPADSLVFDNQGSFIVYIGPQASCSSNESISVLQSELVGKLREVFVKSLVDL